MYERAATILPFFPLQYPSGFWPGTHVNRATMAATASRIKRYTKYTKFRGIRALMGYAGATRVRMCSRAGVLMVDAQ